MGGPNQSPAAPPSGVEITIYAQFNDPWANDAAEVSAMRDQRWEPSNKTFAAVCGVHTSKPWQCEDFQTFAGPITSQKNGSVGRINLVTHANAGLFALGGRFEVTATSTTVYLGELTPGEAPGSGLTSRRMDQDLMNWLNDSDPATGGVGYRDMIRDKLLPDAKFYIYGCHGGAGNGLLLLTEIAATFNVNTYGFHKPIQYDPLYSPANPTPNVPDRIVNRKRTFYDTTAGNAQEGFKHLVSDAPVAKPSKPKP